MSGSYLVLPAAGSSAVSLAVRKAAIRASCAFCASDRIYPHCCRYTCDSPYLCTSTVLPTISGKHKTHNRFPCRRRARGATGSTMVWHAFGTSTSRICLRLMRFRLDLEPRVATSLPFSSVKGKEQPAIFGTNHTVATPYLRDVRTMRVSCTLRAKIKKKAYLHDCRTWWR